MSKHWKGKSVPGEGLQKLSSCQFEGSKKNFTAKGLHLKNFAFQKQVKVTEYNFFQLHHLMANVKIYKYLPDIFALALTISEIYKKMNLQKVGQGDGVQFS